VAWTVGAVVVFAIVGFLALPLVVRPALERNLSAALDRKVTIERLKINPFALSATLSGISVGERGEGPPMLTVPELYANGRILSLFRWAPVVSELKLTGPTLHLVRNADNSYNFSDLLERALAGPPGPPPRFSVSNIQISDGRIDFDDRPEHRQHQVTQLTLGIPFLSSLPSQVEVYVQPTFSALINGRPVGITGETRPFADTRETVLHWNLDGLPLPVYLGYVPVPLPFKVESGKLDAKLDLRFVDHGTNAPELTLAGNVGLADLKLDERSGAPLLRVPSLAVAVDQLDLVSGNAQVRSVAADGVELNIRRESNGELSLASLAPPSKAPGKAGPPARFRVGSLALKHGKVSLSDATTTPNFASALSDVTLDVTNLTNTSGQKATVAASFDTDLGAHVSSRGELGLAPISATGRLEVGGLHIAKLYPYYASALNLSVDDGTLDASTDLRLEGAQELALALTNLEATIKSLKLRPPDQKELLWSVPVVAVHGGSVDVAKQTINFESIESHGAVASIRRGSDGSFNFSRIVRGAEGGTGSTAGQAWRVTEQKIAIDDYAVNFVDEAVTPPARLAFTRVSATLESPSGGTGRGKLQATVNKRGSLSISGPIGFAPVKATLSTVAKDIDLVPFSAYISQAARVVLTGGSVSTRGTLDIAGGTPLRAGFKGDIGLADVAALDEENQTDLLKWKTLQLGTIDAQFEPLAVSIGDIALDQFYARLILNENGEFNLQQLERGRTPAPAPSTPAPTDSSQTVQLTTPPGTETTWLKLGKATLTNGNVYFTDHFVRPNYSANLTELAGGLSTLTFEQPADLELHGKVQETAPVAIVGRINPLSKNLFLDIKADATDIDLPPLSPYSGKYVGYGIEKGKLSMKVHYLIDNRKLTAENGVVLDQLTFGAKVESPDAIKVPVLLAVALLKDRNGVIKFDLPVAGSLDDPKFSVGGIVFRALINLLVKIVTSPFALLGAMGGHGEELAYIEFAPGSAKLDAASDEKIKAIAKALNDRPALKLDVTGRVDPATDRDGLKQAGLDRMLRQQKFKDLERQGQPPPSVDAVEVSPAEYDALLSRVYSAASFTKPRNAIGLPKELPKGEMEALILTNTAVSDEDLRSLGERRAETVRASLVDGQHVPSERVFLVAPRVGAEGAKDKGKPTRVDFALH
jgi:uncharacterized protein involved in outer membrane biogenesis